MQRTDHSIASKALEMPSLNGQFKGFTFSRIYRRQPKQLPLKNCLMMADGTHLSASLARNHLVAFDLRLCVQTGTVHGGRPESATMGDKSY